MFKTVSILTGKVRDHLKGRNALLNLIELKNKGLLDAIIISTWKDELSKYPDLINLCLNNSINVIEINEQISTIQQSHQKIPLLVALGYLPDNSYITRHRFDRVVPNINFAHHLHNIKSNGPDKAEVLGGVFEHKITVNSALIDVPFFYNDLIFSGTKKDLLNLSQMDLNLQFSFNPTVNQEFAFFYSAFSKYLPNPSEYISTFPGLSYANPKIIHALRTIQLNSPFFAKYFAYGVWFCRNFLNIGYKSPIDFYPTFKLEDVMLKSDPDPLPDISYFKVVGHSMCKSNNFFDAIFCNRIVNSKFSEMVIERMNNIGKTLGVKCSEAPRLSEEALNYVLQFQKLGIKNQPLAGYRELGNNNFIQYHIGQVNNSGDSLTRNTSNQNMDGWDIL